MNNFYIFDSNLHNLLFHYSYGMERIFGQSYWISKDGYLVSGLIFSQISGFSARYSDIHGIRLNIKFGLEITEKEIQSKRV